MKTRQDTKKKKRYALHSKFHPETGKRATVGGVLIGEELRFGIAICSPRDQFRRKTGFNKATGRAEMDPTKNDVLDRDGDYQGPLYKVTVSDIKEAGKIFGDIARKFLDEKGFPYKTYNQPIEA